MGGVWMDDGAKDGVTAPRRVSWLFVLTILVGSFLLFLVQPMIARMALPRLGGAPAVWNSAMLVYQALLLGGYSYAHWLRRFDVRRQAAIQIGILMGASLWLPIGLMAMQLPAGAEPALWVPWLLTASIGPLFLAVSAQAPLVQRWFSAASGGQDPYALYAASNMGSFAGLLAYPLLVEPMMPISGQRWLWSGCYLMLLALVMMCALRLPQGGAEQHGRANHPAPPIRRVASWIAYAFVPSGLMLATSTFLTTDIVAVPMLWVLPLGLYLLSFSVAFATRGGAARMIARVAPLTVLLLGGVICGGASDNALLNALIALLLLFVAATGLHARLHALRPPAEQLTGFYLAMAVGGALGGVFAGLLAPILFDWTYEYPLLILVAGMMVPQQAMIALAQRHRRWLLPGVLAGVAWVVVLGLYDEMVPHGTTALLCFLALAVMGVVSLGRRMAYLSVLAGALLLFGGWRAVSITLDGHMRQRSYFGVYTVRDGADYRDLTNGTTLHGRQLTGSSARERVPTTYYSPQSGVGQAMLAAGGLYGPNARIGVVGLGTGTLACYARPGQQWRFFEIDPMDVRLARDSGQFTFLSRCLQGVPIEIGDARLNLSRAPSRSFDLLALDAFSSDSVPVHLMTKEAFTTYRRVLAPNGLLMVHISNRYLALAPVVAATARADHWYAARLLHTPAPDEEEAVVSDWIALSPNADTLSRLMGGDSNWVPLVGEGSRRQWTDDYASILPELLLIHPNLAP